MKQYIIGAFILLLLFLPILQWAAQEVTYDRIMTIHKHTFNAKEQAKQAGRYTDTIVDDLISNITSDVPSISSGEISITATTTPKYRVDTFDEREMIDFEMTLPIKDVIVGVDFLGVSNADLQKVTKFSFPSELPRP